MKKNLVIIGGGISGLLCSYVFKDREDFNVKIIETDDIGGEFLASGMRYVGAIDDEEDEVKTDPIMIMLDDLGLAYTTYLVKGGVFLKNTIHAFPEDFKKFKKEHMDRIKVDFYRKSRLIEPGLKAKNAMSDPANFRHKKAIKFNSRDLVKELAKKANIVKAHAHALTDRHVICSRKIMVPYDYLVLTVPLWEIKRLAWWEVHDADVVKMNTAFVMTDNQRFCQWDYVYTPYTPSDCVYKVISAGCGYIVESSGKFKEGSFHSDLEFLFDGEWKVENKLLGLKGYMINVPEKKTIWPLNIAPLGRFATWDSNATVDVTLDKAKVLLRRWG